MSAILVVDDESAMRALYGRMLLAEGYLPLEATTADEALEILARHQDIPVVIADLQMPGHGGEWLIDRIREQFPHVAVILATANQSVPGTVTLQPSVANYIVKPVSGAQLLAALKNALRWREQSKTQASDESDPIEAFLDTKLNRNHGNGGRRE